MPISRLTVSGYRSIQDVDLKLKQVNVLVGPNGCGKTNLYRSMVLLASAATGQLARLLVEEGGMPSVLWAGPRVKGAVRMTLSVRIDELTYRLSFGLPTPNPTAFLLDPEIKEERVWLHQGQRKIPILQRDHNVVHARDGEGNRVAFPMEFTASESVLAELREPHRYPILAMLQQELTGWRFYHQFRTDAESPLRQPQSGTRTPVLSPDGRDLAAALQTVLENGDGDGAMEFFHLAFPGAGLNLVDGDGRFSVRLQLPGFKRRFAVAELSDGTLRYLCLLAALLSPKPPPLLAINEPETSLHPDLMEPLARLIAKASQQSQLWITTHSEALAGFIHQHTGAQPILLEKVAGATRIVGQRLEDFLEGDEWGR